MLKPGDLVIDYSYARPSLAVAVKAGARAVIRYSAGAASNPTHASHAANAGKLITPAEFKAILAAGMDVIANDEWYESRVTEGYNAGHADGTASAALWRSCGLAKGATVYCSLDRDTHGVSAYQVRRYLSGWFNGAGRYYRPDLYGGTPILRSLLGGVGFRIAKGWRPNAGSWSGDGLPYQPNTTTPAARAALVAAAVKRTPAHIWQTGNYWFAKTADEDLIVRVPVGSHLETVAAGKPPVPKPPPVKPPAPTSVLVATAPDGSTLRFTDGGLIQVTAGQVTRHL